MSYYNKPYYNRWEHTERGGFFGGIALAILVIILLLLSIDPSKPEGGGSSDHAGPVPAMVTKISSDQYFVQDGAKIGPQELCLGSYQGQYTDQVAKIPGGTFVNCYYDQHWSQRNADDVDITYWQAMKNVATTPYYMIGVGAGLLIFLGAFFSGFPEASRGKAERNRVRMDLEQAARELTARWARGEVDDVDYMGKMDGFYGKGLKPATHKDASLTKGA